MNFVSSNDRDAMLEEYERLGPGVIRIIYAGELFQCVNFLDTTGAIYVQYQLYLPEGTKNINLIEVVN